MYTDIKKSFLDEIDEIKQAGMWKDEKVLAGLQGPEIEVDGKKLLNFCSNNYLNLAASPELVRAAVEGMKEYGFGEASVRFICGTSKIHKDLEKEVSGFFGLEDAILYTSCFDANTGLFETILKEGDAVFSDELNHASIIDGIRLCKAERFRFKHSDMADLESQLRTAGERRRKLIATDGVFSMDGETAKIKQLCELAEKYEALLMVDDSHGTGVLGEHGRGSVEGFLDRVDILTSTFGKALGGAGGGFTTGKKEIIEILRQRSRTTLFSNSLPPMIAAAALYVLKNFDKEFIENKGQLTSNTQYFRSNLEKLGFVLGGDGTHPITPIMVFEEHLAVDLSARLLEKGIYTRGFTYPVVPKGKARVRVQISSGHTKDQLDIALKAFKELGNSIAK